MIFPIAKWGISHYSIVMNHNPDIMIDEMLSVAKAYCKAEKIKISTLGRIVVNDGDFFKRLIKTRNCTLTTYKKVMDWFADNKPPKLRSN